MKRLVAALCLFIPFTLSAQDARPAVVRVMFGLQDQTAQDWAGAASVDQGKIEKIDGWMFEKRDKLFLKEFRWECITQFPEFIKRGKLMSRGMKKKPFKKGVVLWLAAPPEAVVSVKTKMGDLSFALKDLSLGRVLPLMDGKASAEIVLDSTNLSDDKNPDPKADFAAGPDDDYPAIACDASGKVFVAWVRYQDKKDEVLLRRLDGKAWSPAEKVSEAPGDFFKAKAAVDGDGRLWVAWAAQVEGNWDLYARTLKDGQWSATIRLTDDPSPDIFHQLVADSTGKVYVCWQSFRAGSGDIFARRLPDGKPIQVSTSDANEWDPAMTADSSGNVWIAYDSYRAGNYDVFLRRLSGDALGNEIPVACSADSELHPSVACDKSGRVWIAYDNYGPKYGKEAGLGDGGLHIYRGKIGLACLDGEEIKAAPSPHPPLPEPETNFEKTYGPIAEMPCLAFDAQGRLWLICRIMQRYVSPHVNAIWEVQALCCRGDKWSDPILVFNSGGRSDIRTGTCLTPDGKRLVAFPTDRRSGLMRGPRTLDVRVAELPTAMGEPVAPALAAMPEAPAAAAIEPRARYQIEMDGKTYHVFWGDLHRHTDISGDGMRDGSLLDLYRYALDAARLDYIAVTDHDAGGGARQYPWWRTQKSADIFHAPPVFVPLYGYERSVGYPGGHRNIVGPERGDFPLARKKDPQDPKETAYDDPQMLYDYMRGKRLVAISHTSATSMGTDWGFNDPVLEPIVEIFQGDRRNYEYPGAPKSEPKEAAYEQFKKGFVSEALKKGYRLGFIASSDHWSTHMSYAAVYAERYDRDAIFEALQNRRTFGSSAKVIVDFRMGKTFMGGETTTAEPPTMTVKGIAATELSKIDIVRNSQVLHTVTPAGREFEFTFVDKSPLAGETAYYYARVEQKSATSPYEDNMDIAWSSPVWVTCKKD
ncbi:MAG: hypothetical protein AB1696_29325 [Planctomycetota bacterium]